MPSWLFPVAQIALSMGAAGVYALSGSYPKALYFVLGAAITAVVAFLL